MKRHNIEFLWGWFDALRRRDTEAMTEALDPVRREEALAAAARHQI